MKFAKQKIKKKTEGADESKAEERDEYGNTWQTIYMKQ